MYVDFGRVTDKRKPSFLRDASFRVAGLRRLRPARRRLPGRVQQTHRAPDRDRPPSAVAACAVFRQTPEPGRMALSDVADGEEDQRDSRWKDRSTNELGIIIAGAPSPHRPFQFVMTCSGRQNAAVVPGGEDVTALAGNLRDTRSDARRRPREHRTDSLSAADRNQNLDAGAAMTAAPRFPPQRLPGRCPPRSPRRTLAP